MVRAGKVVRWMLGSWNTGTSFVFFVAGKVVTHIGILIC